MLSRLLVGMTPFVCLLGSVVYGQVSAPVLCDAYGSNDLRPTGVAELIDSITISCVGGIPGSVITTDISLTLDVPLTSKVVNGVSESVLIVGTPDQNAQILEQTVFQASGPGVTFQGVKFTAPGYGTGISMTIRNVRVDVHGRGINETNLSSSLALVNARLQMTNVVVPLDSYQVATIRIPLRASLLMQPGKTAGLRQCEDQNTPLLLSPPGTGAVSQFVIRYQENLTTQTRPRTFGSDPLAPGAQTLLDRYYYTDSGYYNPSLPAINGLNTAGLASQGDRFMMRFSNVPSGVQVFVSTRAINSNIPDHAVLIRTDSTGNGQYSPILPTAKVSTIVGTSGYSVSSDMAPVTIVNGEGLAVWEVTWGDALAINYFDFPVAFAYAANQPATGTATIQMGHGPQTTIFDGKSQIVPRFVAPATQFSFGVFSCSAALPNLVVSDVTVPSNPTGGEAVPVTATIQNWSTTDAFASDAEIHWLSYPPLTPSDYLMGTCSAGPIAGNSSAICRGTLYLPESGGSYQVKVFANAANLVPESSKADNSRTVPITVTPCQYQVATTNLQLPAAANWYSISVSTTIGCSWVLSSSTDWIQVKFPYLPAGAVTGRYHLSANTTGAPRMGTLTVAGKTVTITQGAASPGEIVPAVDGFQDFGVRSGNGSLQFTFSSPWGGNSIDVVNVLINDYLDARKACYLAYSRVDNGLYLVADSGDATKTTRLAVGTAGSISNSQCSISQPSATINGNTLSLYMNVTFSASFAGAKVIYGAARDSHAGNSGWQTIGAHHVPGTAPVTYPRPASVTPAFEASLGTTIAFTYQDETSVDNLQTMWALINTAIDGRHACYIAYYRPGNMIYLYPDNGDGSKATSMVLTGTNSLSNSQCTVRALRAVVQTNGNTLTLYLPVEFTDAFAGQKGIWLANQTLSGKTSSWQALGAWQVPTPDY